ncbi:MarR family winged helix-turn-helix transcriptional regulator [Nocardiopsis aegyptia]|uniref:MarR family winged helix-turn-helix transcriptional regulator n=1 Tax=Nocardiopsis aegyptia TaxID=220378 RepID=UPI00366DB2D6
MDTPAFRRQPGSGQDAASEPVSAREIIALLFDTSHRMCLHSDRLLGASIGLSEARARLLVTVGDREPARMGRLASDLGVSARSVTGMVDALEREGLITREPDPDDRRATLLRLTADSRDRMHRLHEAQNRLAEELLAPLSSEDRADLHRVLHLLRSAAARPGPE